MSEPTLSFGARFALAFAAFFRILSDGLFAARVKSAEEPAALPAPKPEPKPEPVKTVVREATPDAAYQLLSILQREGRFIDFLEEDVSSFSDAEIGAAARVVHEGCKKSLREHVTLAPVRSETEESRITVDKGFDAGAIRVTGNVVGEPPFTGTLRHRGWRVTELRLPKIAEGHDARVIAPAEVEL